MNSKNQSDRILFGLKVKQIRQHNKLSFSDLSKKTGMSISYLNEIEKGKKFPKTEKLNALSEALGHSIEDLLDISLDDNLAPIADLLNSNFLNELPLDLFGIDLAKVVEIISNAPARVGAFISTLLEISRNYALKEENFYFAALRSYLELHNNYFEDLENAAGRFADEFEIPAERPINHLVLRRILEQTYRYKIVDHGLDAYPELKHLRSVYVPSKKRLLLNSELSDEQKAFQYAKEIGFQYLKLKERSQTSSIVKGEVFEEVLNHSRAIYFAMALFAPEPRFAEDLKHFFSQKSFDGRILDELMDKYGVMPEGLYHRMTNILPHSFEMNRLFFIRVVHDTERQYFDIDRELHLTHHHHPHGNGLHEHYCRRWVSISSLNAIQNNQSNGEQPRLAVAQISKYYNTDDEYLCLTIVRPAHPSPAKSVSVTIGLLITPELKEQIQFVDDPAITRETVHTTCERCPIQDCKERVVPPSIVNKRRQTQLIHDRLAELL